MAPHIPSVGLPRRSILRRPFSLRSFLNFMFEFWHGFTAAIESVIMLPSLIQAVFHPLSTKKRMHDALGPHSVNMDDFLRDVKRLFEAPLPPLHLLSLSGKLQESFQQRLQSSNICMLPSYNHTLPSGRERGTYLALDVGGSTFRVALVELNGKNKASQCMQITKMRIFTIDNAIRALEGRAFFDWMAQRIAETLMDPEVRKITGNSTLPMGLSWSFPVEQNSIRSGFIVDMGKDFRAREGLLGKDLSEVVMDSCNKLGLNVRMDAIVNDSTATLLAQAYKDSTTKLALILGTGTNASIHLPVSAFARSKFGNRPQSWFDEATHVLVNTELSLFGKDIFPTTRWDDYLNMAHSRPDFQPLEMLMSGRYLGEITRLICIEAIRDAGLFDGEIPEKFSEPYSLDTGTLAAFEADDTPLLSKASATFLRLHPLSKPPSYSDLLFIRHVSHLVSRRASAYLATCIHALWSLRLRSEGFKAATVEGLMVGCNGSVIEKYPCFMELCQKYIDELTGMSGANSRAIVLETAVESALFGAAVAVCCLEGQ